VVEAEPEPNERTEVVGDQPDPPKRKLVEQREHVGENLVHGVPVGRRVRPTSAAQVGRDHAVALGERQDDLAPLPPVLREAVQEQDRRGIRVPGLGYVHPQAGRERTNAWVTPGSSGISVGCTRPDAAGPRGALGVSVTTPLYYLRTGQFTTRDLRRGPRVHHGPSREKWLFVAAGRTGEQMIVVLDGTRDAPGACRLEPDVVQRWPAGQAAAGLQGCLSVHRSSGTTTTPRVTVSEML
jgi:hypothetical protein